MPVYKRLGLHWRHCLIRSTADWWSAESVWNPQRNSEVQRKAIGYLEQVGFCEQLAQLNSQTERKPSFRVKLPRTSLLYQEERSGVLRLGRQTSRAKQAWEVAGRQLAAWWLHDCGFNSGQKDWRFQPAKRLWEVPVYWFARVTCKGDKKQWFARSSDCLRKTNAWSAKRSRKNHSQLASQELHFRPGVELKYARQEQARHHFFSYSHCLCKRVW